jgi:L-asparaginase
MKKKKILMILTGGTFGMAEGLSQAPLKPAEVDGNHILKVVPEVEELADLEWVSIFNLDSSDISPTHWENIGKTIKDNYKKYDGFVVIHGTDTMVYSAAATSYMMKGTQKPVIFTGSQRPLSKIRSDARDNLISSVEFATCEIPEVAIAFGSELFRGNRAKKISIEDYNAFKSYNYPILAKVGVTLEIRTALLRTEEEPNWEFGFDTRIALLKVFPGMTADLLRESLTGGKVKGLILEGFGSGNLPEIDESWLRLISDLKKLMVPTVITSQCPQGIVNLNAYENGLKAIHKGAISCGNITTEAAVVKLMFALKRKKYYNDIVDFMRTGYCGEM